EHPRRHVDADDAPAVADDSSGGQCRESGAGRGVQHVVARSEITQRDEPLRAEPMPWVLRVGWRAAVERPGDLPDVLHNWRLTKPVRVVRPRRSLSSTTAANREDER